MTGDQHIGIFGGTFDPPHHAHLLMAEQACEMLALSQLLFVPAAIPPHKDTTRAGTTHRLKMLELALRDNPHFTISRVDVDRPGPHYSADMVRLLYDQYPAARFSFIMGEDSFRNFHTWNRPEALYRDGRLTLAVMIRTCEGKQITADYHADRLPDLAQYVRILPFPVMEVSSSDIVQRLRSGASVRYLIPDIVIAYIREHQLYQT